MKRRKPPIVLIGILAICLAVIVFFSMNFAKMTGGEGPGFGNNEPTVGHSKQAPSKEELKKAVKDAPVPEDKESKGPRGPKGMNSQASIESPKPRIDKPKPDDSSTGSGWYRDESGLK